MTRNGGAAQLCILHPDPAGGLPPPVLYCRRAAGGGRVIPAPGPCRVPSPGPRREAQVPRRHRPVAVDVAAQRHVARRRGGLSSVAIADRSLPSTTPSPLTSPRSR